jgi:tRNA wybutosine-synthesizing protein 3
MDFSNNKKTALSKSDKSKKGSIDIHILQLIDSINASDSYFSTSSCSGRIILIREGERKNEADWEFVSHELVEYNDLHNAIAKLADRKNVWLRFEPPIVHISCKTLEDAQKLLDISRPLFKVSGIISTQKNIVEIRSTERIDVPVEAMSEEHLKIIIDLANSKLQKGWNKINQLEKEIVKII